MMGRPPLPALALAAMLPLASCTQKPPPSYDFEEDGVLDELTWTCGTLFRLVDVHATSGARSLEMRIFPRADALGGYYPGIALSRFERSWGDFRSIRFDVYNPDAVPVALTLRIDDTRDPDRGDRFTKTFQLPAGASRIVVERDELRTSGSRRLLDLNSIRRVLLFLSKPARRMTLYLDNVRLE